MILQTYQSTSVLTTLKQEQIYRAKPSISFKTEYEALIDMLKLDCQCPVFTIVKGRKQKTAGRVSAAVKLTLNVPDEMVKLTEFGIWADFMYGCKFSKANNYRMLKPNCEEMTNRKYQGLITSLETQLPLEMYHYPQAILEEIKPEWLVSYKIIHGGKANSHHSDVLEKIINIFRK